MLIREMHYDFKLKYNKTDSQVNRNYLVPEIDWLLNEAEGIFVKVIAEPRVKNNLGFETSQRTIDDIRSVVVSDISTPIVNNTIALPSNYQHFVKGTVVLRKGDCPLSKPVRVLIKQSDDEFEKSPFDNSNYNWREVVGTFNQNGIQVQLDGTFTIEDAKLTYIRKRAYMHNAQDFSSGTYLHPSGATLNGSVNCELPEHTHREIVDIAVMLASGQVQTSDYQIKMNKLNFNQLI